MLCDTSIIITDTHHIIEGRVLAATLTTVCIECRFRVNAPSSACYIIFNSTHGAAVIRKIEKPVTVSVIHNCFNLIPDGVYSISIIDGQSYKNNLNNTAVVLSSLITISHSTTEMSFFMSSTTLLQYSTSKSEQELYSTPVGMFQCVMIIFLFSIFFSFYTSLKFYFSS